MENESGMKKGDIIGVLNYPDLLFEIEKYYMELFDRFEGCIKKADKKLLEDTGIYRTRQYNDVFLGSNIWKYDC